MTFIVVSSSSDERFLGPGSIPFNPVVTKPSPERNSGFLVTSHTPEEFGFNPALTVLIFNLPEVNFHDLCNLFDRQFSYAHYSTFLVSYTIFQPSTSMF